MHTNYLWLIALVLIIAGGGYWLSLGPSVSPAEEPVVLSFEDCAAAGYPVMESYPRQCRTPDGRTYAEELPPPPLTYVNASADLIVVETPLPGSVTGKEFTIMGKARGTWYFEASFPIGILDADGNVIASGYAEATSDWMTEEFVPFTATIKAPETYMGLATVVLKNDNPSGEPSRDRSASFPITIEY